MNTDQEPVLTTAVGGGGALLLPTLKPSSEVSAVKQQLSHRVLAVTTSEAIPTAAHIDTVGGGLVVAGADALGTVRQLKLAYPNLILLADPTSHNAHISSEAEPFMLDGDGLFPFSLADHLANQVGAGADIAITPTGFIETGNVKALKSALKMVNAVDRDDVLFLLPVHPRWCVEPNVQQLIAVAKRSRHPVALTLGNKTDPLATKGVPAGFRRFFSEVAWAMP